MATPQVVEKKPNIEAVSYGRLTWLNIEKPTPQETEYLAQNYPFHPLDLENFLEPLRFPKLDVYKDYLFLAIQFPIFDKAKRVTRPSEVDFFVGRDFVITGHVGELKPLAKLFRECQMEEQVREQTMGHSSGYLLYRIVDALADYCFRMVDKTLSNLETIEDAVFDTKVDASQEIATLRRDIAAQRRIIGLTKTVIADLEHKAQRFTDMDIKVYLGDVNDHLNRLWSNLEECRETIEIYKDTDFLLSQERTNKILAVLTIVFTVTLPALMVGGFYGMNINLPGGIETGTWTFLGRYTTFILALLLGLVPAGVMFWLFRRWHWI